MTICIRVRAKQREDNRTYQIHDNAIQKGNSSGAPYAESSTFFGFFPVSGSKTPRNQAGPPIPNKFAIPVSMTKGGIASVAAAT